jgi:hypothetical protein
MQVSSSGEVTLAMAAEQEAFDGVRICKAPCETIPDFLSWLYRRSLLSPEQPAQHTKITAFRRFAALPRYTRRLRQQRRLFGEQQLLEHQWWPSATVDDCSSRPNRQGERGAVL